MIIFRSSGHGEIWEKSFKKNLKKKYLQYDVGWLSARENY